MAKVRNVVFVTLFGLILFSGIGFTFVTWSDSEKDSFNLNLEGREATTVNQLTESSFFDKTLQDVSESFIADRIPYRDQLLLASAGLQRQSIAQGSALMGYSLYPTYFGSKYFAIPEDGVVYKNSAKRPKTKQVDAFVEVINKAAKQYPDVKFVVALELEQNQTRENPTYKLITGAKLINSSWAKENYLDKFSSEVSTVQVTVESLQELERDWYKSDHHWTQQRAFDTYNEIAGILDLKPAEWREEEAVTVSDAWVGGNGREACILDYPDTLVDMPDDFSHLHYYRLVKDGAGKPFNPGLRSQILDGTKSASDLPQFDAYKHYYGGSTAVYVENEGKNNGKTCLLVADSFAWCLKDYFANNYEKTIIIYPGNVEVKKSLRWHIKQYGVDDVVVMMHGTKFGLLNSYSPKFAGAES